MIETQALTKCYGAVTVVNNVSLRIPNSGVTSIIGPNGAGKSTLMALISRLVPMTRGAVTVDGMDIATTPSDVLARRLAILRQDNHIAVRLTVYDLVAFGRYPHSKGRLTVSDQEPIERALRYLGITSLRDRFIDELSGGQRQRAFLAMVLCQETHYVLLDEPLNSLDLKHAVATMKLLRRYANELEKAVVLVLHDINFASYYSDYIVAMRDGGVLFEGHPDLVMQTDRLQELYDMNINSHSIAGRRFLTYYG
jgi:iron complex transport system ATP-binding protein